MVGARGGRSEACRSSWSSPHFFRGLFSNSPLCAHAAPSVIKLTRYTGLPALGGGARLRFPALYFLPSSSQYLLYYLSSSDFNLNTHT